MDVIQRIEALFLTHGHTLYDGRRAEAVTAQQHALQCAQLAEWAGSPPALVAAALLHDIGHFVGSGDENIDDAHEQRALRLLSLDFGRAVLEPLRLHVEAKRYLVALHPQYASKLSPASQHSLALQGGAMNADERRWFESLPYAEEAVALRRFDDAAKAPGQRTPPMAYYLGLIEPLCLRRATAEAQEFGPD